MAPAMITEHDRRSRMPAALHHHGRPSLSHHADAHEGRQTAGQSQDHHRLEEPMIVSKLPKFLMLLVVLALAGTLAVAGCGGGGSSSSGSTSEEAAPPAEEIEEAPEEETGEAGEEEEEAGGVDAGGGAAMAEGKTIFSSNCASCHTLKAAGASATIGTDLDELMPDEETVEKQVISGGGPMPAFGNKEILTPEEIKTVSAYVAAEAGQ